MNKIYKVISVLAAVCVLTVSFFPLHVCPSENVKKVFINESCNDRLLNTMRISTIGNVETYCRNSVTGDYAAMFAKEKDSESPSQLMFKFDCENKLVLELDVFLCSGGEGAAHMFLLHSPDGVYSRSLLLKSDGSLLTGSNQTLAGNIPTDTWVTLSAVFDFDLQTFDLYINGKKIKSSLGFHREIHSVDSWYIGWPGGGEGASYSGAIYADNFKAYEGDAIRDISDADPEYAFNTMEAGYVLLKSSVAFNYASQRIFSYGNELNHADSIKKSNGKFYASSYAISKSLGVNVSVKNSAVSVNGKAIDDCIISDESYFLSVKEVASALSMYYCADYDRNFCIITDKKTDSTSAAFLDASDITLYNFCTPAEVRSKFSKKSPSHPYVLIDSSDVDSMKKYYGSDTVFTYWVNTVISDSDKILGEDTAKYLPAEDTGQLLAQSRLALNRVLSLGVSYFITEKAEYYSRALKELKAVCEFPDWNNNVHYLDTAEMAAAVSVGYDWFYDCMTDSDRKYFEEKLYSYVLIHSHRIYEGNGTGISWFWAKNKHNWCAVCNGGTVMAACAVFDKYPEICSDIISYSLKSVADMARTAYPDGGWEEGSGYAVYCMKYVSFMNNTLKNTLGTDFNLLLGFYGICDFLMSIDGPGGSFNYHDSYPEHAMCEINGSLSRMFDRTDLIYARINAIDSFGLDISPLDVIYYKPIDECAKINTPADMFFRGNDVAFMRGSFNDAGSVFAAIQAGYPICGHSHLDGGTFTVDMLGERWVHSLPQDSYGLDGYFGTTETRYSYYRTRTESENCYVINPSDGGYGQNINNNVYITNFELGINTSYAIVDLTPAYDKDVLSAKRGLRLTDNKNSVVLRDEITFSKESNELYWFINLSRNAQVDISNDKKVIITNPSGKSLELLFDIDGFDSFDISVMDAVPLPSSPNPAGQNKNSGLKKLAVHAFGSGKTYINVRFFDPNGKYAHFEYDSTETLESWVNHEKLIPIDIKCGKDASTDKFGAELSLKNAIPDNDAKIMMFCVSYSENKIRSVSVKKVSLSKTGILNIKDNVDIGDGEDTVRIFVTDEKLKPLTECIDANLF